MERPNIINERYPHIVRIVRLVGDGDPFADDSERKVILYEGRGRSFTDTTTEGDKLVDENKRKSSIPVRFDEWDEGQKPLDGDTIISIVGNNTEVGIVKDSEPDNNRTLIYWDYRRV